MHSCKPTFNCERVFLLVYACVCVCWYNSVYGCRSVHACFSPSFARIPLSEFCLIHLLTFHLLLLLLFFFLMFYYSCCRCMSCCCCPFKLIRIRQLQKLQKLHRNFLAFRLKCFLKNCEHSQQQPYAITNNTAFFPEFSLLLLFGLGIPESKSSNVRMHRH